MPSPQPVCRFALNGVYFALVRARRVWCGICFIIPHSDFIFRCNERRCRHRHPSFPRLVCQRTEGSRHPPGQVYLLMASAVVFASTNCPLKNAWIKNKTSFSHFPAIFLHAELMDQQNTAGGRKKAPGDPPVRPGHLLDTCSKTLNAGPGRPASRILPPL